MTNRAAEESFMHRALALAYRAWGRTHPNPMVGAIIVERGKVVAEGFTAPDGGPHAERVALAALGRAPKPGASLYTTMEPCSTKGRTGACTEAIIGAGIKHVVVGAPDPESRPCRPRVRDHAGGGGRGRLGGPRAGGLRPQPHLQPLDHPALAAPRREIRHLPGWPDRHALRRIKVDHRGGGPRRRPSVAAAVSGHRGRRGHDRPRQPPPHGAASGWPGVVPPPLRLRWAAPDGGRPEPSDRLHRQVPRPHGRRDHPARGPRLRAQAPGPGRPRLGLRIRDAAGEPGGLPEALLRRRGSAASSSRAGPRWSAS